MISKAQVLILSLHRRIPEATMSERVARQLTRSYGLRVHSDGLPHHHGI